MLAVDNGYPSRMLKQTGHALMRVIYNITMYVLTPVILYRLALRGVRHRGYLSRWAERFGFFPDPGLRDSLWVHAVSVGEVNAAAPMIDVLRERYPQYPIVVTTVTPTGSDRVRRIWGDSVFHVYLPYDLPASIRRFLKRVRPKLAIIMETEIWPNLFFSCHESGLPIVVANARLSERSLRGYGPVRPLARMAIRCAEWVAAQSQQDAERLIELGADRSRVIIAGNLKYDMDVPEFLSEQARDWREAWGEQRPVWIAASTHEGEEEKVIDAHSRVLRRFPDALLLIAPRHPERFRPVLQLCRQMGFRTSSRSEDGLASVDSQCFVIDTLGELLGFFSAADVAFVGGSFTTIGGHNVLEPAALGVPVLVGPHTFNFTEVTDLLMASGACLRVANDLELAETVQSLLDDKERCNNMGCRALETVQAQRGALRRILSMLKGLLGSKMAP